MDLKQTETGLQLELVLDFHPEWSPELKHAAAKQV